MGKHSTVLARPSGAEVATQGVARAGSGRRIRLSRTHPALSFGAALALVAVPCVDPTAAFAINDQVQIERDYGIEPDQVLVASGDAQDEVDRDGFTITEKVIEKAVASAPAVGKPDPGSAKEIAYKLVKDRGWNEKQYNCLVALWNRESHWNVNAHNNGSGAHGIPQALPGSKMASVGSDWATNPKTQIKWGLGYIAGRYGTPCAAWASSEERGWY